jgi:hypothetical protein
VTDNTSTSPQTANLAGTGTPPQTFTVSSPTGTQTVQPGGSATYTITVTPQNGAFNNVVSLTASGLPSGAKASFSPASLTPGSTAASSKLNIQTSASTASAGSLGWPVAAPVLAVLCGLFLPVKRRRRWIARGLLLLASLGALTALGGCSGGFALVPPVTSYTISVTATSGSDVQTTTVQLTVE